MTLTDTEQAVARYWRNRVEAHLCAARVLHLQRLMLRGVNVSDALDDAIMVERAMRATHQAATAEMLRALPGLLVAACQAPRRNRQTGDERARAIDAMEEWPV